LIYKHQEFVKNQTCFLKTLFPYAFKVGATLIKGKIKVVFIYLRLISLELDVYLSP